MHNDLTMLQLPCLTNARRNDIALSDGHVDYSGEWLRTRSDAVASELARAGVTRGDRVAIMLGNTPAFAVALLSVMRLGASAVLLSPRFIHREVEDAIERTGPVAVIARIESAGALASTTTEQVSAPSIQAIEARAAVWRTNRTRLDATPDECIVQFTSGSLGRAKIVARTSAAVLDEVEQFAERLQLGAAEATACPCPLFHAYGLIDGLLVPLFSGRAAIVFDWFVPSDALRVIEQRRPAMFVGVPVMYRALAETFGAAPRQLASLRYCVTAGAPLTSAVADQFHATFGHRVRQQYGTTETGVISINLSDEGDALSVGVPVGGRHISFAEHEDGGREIVVSSAGNATAYLDEPELTIQKFGDGGYRTGDLGHLNESGQLVLTGRHHAFINVTGLKVDPTEVESVLSSFDAISECAVVPAKESNGDEAVRAVVVARRVVTAKEVQVFCRQHLAPYKVPRHVSFVDQLPRSATGKVLLKYLVD